jgi:ferrous iron transport protein A
VCRDDITLGLAYNARVDMLLSNVNDSHLVLIMHLSLSDLKLNSVAVVEEFTQLSAACRQKLFACGLIPGAKLKIQCIAPMGDPIQIQLAGDIILSIRKSEGRHIYVTKL